MSDVVFTTSVTANSMQSTTFIAATAAANSAIVWTSPTIAGVYTVTLTATIVKTTGNVVTTTTFVLTVMSC